MQEDCCVEGQRNGVDATLIQILPRKVVKIGVPSSAGEEMKNKRPSATISQLEDGQRLIIARRAPTIFRQSSLPKSLVTDKSRRL